MNHRRVRALRFLERSTLPVSAACLIANGLRESLASIVREEAAVRLFAPTLPSAHAWAEIVRGATMYRVRGSLAEAVLVLRPAGAAALAAAAFGEFAAQERVISALERTALERVMRAFAVHFEPVCGSDARLLDALDEPGALTTYFEVQFERPVQARLGIGLRSEPALPRGPALVLEDLTEVPITISVRVDAGSLPAAALAMLEPGDVVPLPAGPLRGALCAAGRALAFGECGVSGSRYAFALEHLAPQGSTPAR